MPSALIFVSLKEAEVDWHDRPGRYFWVTPVNDLRAHAHSADLIVDEIERSKGRGYGDEDTIRLSLTARKKL